MLSLALGQVRDLYVCSLVPVSSSFTICFRLFVGNYLFPEFFTRCAMDERQQLEADLENAKDALARAAAALGSMTTTHATANATPRNGNSSLRSSVTTLGLTRADQAKVDQAQSNLEEARVRCRRAAAALNAFNRANATPWSTQTGTYLVRKVKSDDAKASHRGKSSGAAATRHKSKANASRGILSRALLIKQSVMLSALVLAYLQYYLIDINLQIAQLPVNTVQILS